MSKPIESIFVITSIYVTKIREMNLYADFETDKMLAEEGKEFYLKQVQKKGRHLTEKEWIDLLDKLGLMASESVENIRNSRP